MNKPKHTRGRWYYDEETQTVRAPALIGDGHWFTVATCDRRNDNNDADAQLIAAAPDLLEACQAVLDWAQAPGNHGGNPYMHKFVELAEQAIKEATK